MIISMQLATDLQPLPLSPHICELWRTLGSPLQCQLLLGDALHSFFFGFVSL